MELQKKLGLPLEKEKKKPEMKIKRMMPSHHLHMHQKFNNGKFVKAEYNNYPKEENIEDNESNEYNLKMKTIDDWGQCLLNKTQEITNKLAEIFKGFFANNISLDNENLKKEKKKK